MTPASARPRRGRDLHEPHRVSTPLELLFDLTFVVAIALAAARSCRSTAARRPSNQKTIDVHRRPNRYFVAPSTVNRSANATARTSCANGNVTSPACTTYS